LPGASVGIRQYSSKQVSRRGLQPGGFFELLTYYTAMILENIKNGCTISPEYYAALQKEILVTHTIIQTPRRGTITVRIRKIYSERGERINSPELFFYVHCHQEAGIKK
jgi:hypothetical protein